MKIPSLPFCPVKRVLMIMHLLAAFSYPVTIFFKILYDLLSVVLKAFNHVNALYFSAKDPQGYHIAHNNHHYISYEISWTVHCLNVCVVCGSTCFEISLTQHCTQNRTKQYSHRYKEMVHVDDHFIYPSVIIAQNLEHGY